MGRSVCFLQGFFAGLKIVRVQWGLDKVRFRSIIHPSNTLALRRTAAAGCWRAVCASVALLRGPVLIPPAQVSGGFKGYAHVVRAPPQPLRLWHALRSARRQAIFVCLRRR